MAALVEKYLASLEAEKTAPVSLPQLGSPRHAISRGVCGLSVFSGAIFWADAQSSAYLLRHQCRKLFGAIGKAFGYKMHHRATAHTPFNMNKTRADNNAPIFLKPVGPLTILPVPVSSSSVKNTTPRALPDAAADCRPATPMRRHCLPCQSRKGRTLRACISSRKNAIGCA